jgi:hypothetical protein
LGLFVLLDVVNALDSPGGDLMAPTIGLVVSVPVSVAFYIALRRHVTSAAGSGSR